MIFFFIKVFNNHMYINESLIAINQQMQYTSPSKKYIGQISFLDDLN